MAQRKSGIAGDEGTTLVELLTVILMMAVMMGIAIPGFVSYRQSSEHTGARDEVVSTLRHVAERALSEQRRYCVEFSSDGWSVYRFACAGATAVPIQTGVTLDATSESLAGTFTAPSGHVSACGGGGCVYFYPRGNSSDGSVTVTRAGRPTYTIDVEGLTSRVSTSG